jgi:predicted ATP-grasp superfamily ATP-dependent carboligase
VAASGKEEILKAARQFHQAPFILKPNRGGKGLGVQLFNSVDELEKQLSDETPVSLDGIALIQEYIKPARGFITRMEFIDGKFYYAVEVDTSDGFELCPADSCAVGDAFCPAPTGESKAKFRLNDDFHDPELIEKLETFFRANDIEVAAAEFVEDNEGNRYVYDLNMNTNYNQQAERDSGSGKRAMYHLAEFLGEELATISESVKYANQKPVIDLN